MIATSSLFWLQAWSGGTNVWLLLSLFSVQQAFFAVNQPTRSAVLPRLLPLPLLPAANSLNMTVMQAGAIGGPLIAGALIPVFGYSWLYLIDTITLIPTLGAVLALPALPIEGTTGSLGLRAVLDGLKYLRGHPVLMMSFLVDIIAMVFGMPRALFPEIAHLDFGGPEGGGMAFALLFAGIPLGAVLGGVFSGWVSRVERHGLAVIASILVWGAAMLGFGLAVGLADRWRLPMLAVAVLMLVDRWRRRHGLGRVPGEHAAERGVRRRTRSAAGCLHRRRRGRSADRRRGTRCGRGVDRRRRDGRRWRSPGDRRHGAGRGRLPGVHPLPRGRRERPANLTEESANAVQ